MPPSEDCDSDDEKPGDLGFFYGNDGDWVFRPCPQNPAAGNVERKRLPPQEISVIEGLIAGVVGETKYCITVNSLSSVGTIRWKHSERSSHRVRFLRANQTVDGLGAKNLHSISSSSI